MTRYGELRDALGALQREFEWFSACRLYHDLIWSPECEGWTDEEYAAFVQANTRKGGVAWEQWGLWPNRVACDRYWASADSATFVQEFTRLARRAYCLLHEFGKVTREDRPNESKVTLATWAERHRTAGSGDETGWLELLHEWGQRFPTTGLQARCGWWGHEGPSPRGGDIEALNERTSTSVADAVPFHVHPSFSSLELGVFQSSAEFLRLCLTPEEIVDVRIWDRDRQIDLPPEPARPFWNAEAGELWYCGLLVKKFVKPAHNQRKVLDAFQQQNWRPAIPNPFSKGPVADPASAEALRNSAEALNDNHKTPAILHFGTTSNYDKATWTALR